MDYKVGDLIEFRVDYDDQPAGDSCHTRVNVIKTGKVSRVLYNTKRCRTCIGTKIYSVPFDYILLNTCKPQPKFKVGGCVKTIDSYYDEITSNLSSWNKPDHTPFNGVVETVHHCVGDIFRYTIRTDCKLRSIGEMWLELDKCHDQPWIDSEPYVSSSWNKFVVGEVV